MAGAKGIFAVRGLSGKYRKQDCCRLQEFGCKKSCVNHAAHHIGGSVRDEIRGHREAAKEREAEATSEMDNTHCSSKIWNKLRQCLNSV